MAISKVVYKSSPSANPEVWMDTTDKTVTNSDMLDGVTALKADGTTATGNIVNKTSSDLSVSGATVTAPAGHYANNASASVDSMTLPTAASASGSGTEKAVITPGSSAQYINIPTGYNGTAAHYKINAGGSGSSKNVQIAAGVDRTNQTTYTAISGQSITVAETGTYDVYWVGFRSSTGGTNGSCLYIGNNAHTSGNQTTFTNHGQTVHISNVALTKNDVVTVHARARGTSYYMYVGNLTIVQK